MASSEIVLRINDIRNRIYHKKIELENIQKNGKNSEKIIILSEELEELKNEEEVLSSILLKNFHIHVKPTI